MTCERTSMSERVKRRTIAATVATIALSVCAPNAASARGGGHSGSHTNSHSSAHIGSHSTSRAAHHPREPHGQAPGPLAGRDSRGRITRSKVATRQFERSHPCPSTGRTSGGCKGYVIDHIAPLKRGGADSPSNMQWQTIEAAKAKDRIE